MKAGKVPESVLKRSVIKQVKVNKDKILTGPGVGVDFGAVYSEKGETFVFSTSPVTGSAKEIGVTAFLNVVNNVAVSGADPVGVMVTVLLPVKTEESVLRELLKEIANLAKTSGMAILGGHTEMMDAVNAPVISITGVGKVKREKMVSAAGAKAGQDIVMTKYAAAYGTSQIAREQEEALLTRYPKSFLTEAQDMDKMYSIVAEAAIAREFNISAMHDVSECGVYGALWELAAASKVGLEIDLAKVPVKQHTIEVCEFFDLNPYMLRGNGSLLIATDHGSALVDALLIAGIEAAIIGHITDDQDRVIIYGEEADRRFLEPPRRDEIYRIKE